MLRRGRRSHGTPPHFPSAPSVCSVCSVDCIHDGMSLFSNKVTTKDAKDAKKGKGKVLPIFASFAIFVVTFFWVIFILKDGI